MDLEGGSEAASSRARRSGVTSVAKISDRVFSARRAHAEIAKSTRPEHVLSVIEDAEGGSARGVNPYQQFVRVQNKQTEPGVQSCLSHSSGRSRSDNLPRRRVLRTRREAPARRRYKHGSYTVPQGM